MSRIQFTIAFFLFHFSIVAANDVLTVLNASGRQCSSGGTINSVGRVAFAVQDSSGAADFILLNPDGSGNAAKRITGNGFLNATAIASTKDDGFVVIGSIHTSSAGNDAIIMKLSATGNLQWKKILGTAEEDEFRSVAVLNDGSIVVAGHRVSAVTSFDLIVSRFSARGGLLWKKVVGTSAFEHAGGIGVLPDNTFVLAGGTEIAGITRAFWTKFSPSGAILWSRVASTPDSVGLFFLPDQQGGFLLGYLAPLRQGALGKTYVAHLNAAENVVWSKTFGSNGNSLNVAPGFIQTDGSFFLAGNAFNAGPGVDKGVIVKISASGVPKWKRSYSTSGSTIFSSLVPDLSSQFLIAGGCVNQGTDLEDVSVVQLPVSGTLPACSSLRKISFTTANAPFSWTNFSIAKLPVSFHTQKPALTSTNFSVTTSTVCP